MYHYNDDFGFYLFSFVSISLLSLAYAGLIYLTINYPLTDINFLILFFDISKPQRIVDIFSLVFSSI
jgi:hypothetical protein